MFGGNGGSGAGGRPAARPVGISSTRVGVSGSAAFQAAAAPASSSVQRAVASAQQGLSSVSRASGQALSSVAGMQRSGASASSSAALGNMSSAYSALGPPTAGAARPGVTAAAAAPASAPAASTQAHSVGGRPVVAPVAAVSVAPRAAGVTAISAASTSNAGPAGASSVASSPAATPTAGGGKGLSPHGLVRKERIRFTMSDMALSTTVGTGTFGRVRLAYHKPGNSWHVLKILKKSEIIRQKQVEHIKDEVKILSLVYHPFIVNMLGLLQDDRKMYMLLEYVPGGELFSHLRREGKLSDSASRFYAAEIALAFEYLHAHNIVYRDLKPENLLLTAKGHVKITDFGFAKIVEDRTYTLCGTPEYLAPEIIQSKGHSKGVDWWAIGILIYEMLAGYPPFYDENPYGIYQKILAGKIEWPKSFSKEARDLITRLLTADRTKRLGCQRAGPQEIKDHPWFAKVNWDSVYACAVVSPYTPKVRDASDTSNFDDYPDSDGEAERITGRDNDVFADLDKF